MQIGYKLFAEDVAPKELIRRAVEAERAGFDFVEISDHFHPWLPEHQHSPFAWAILSAIAARTDTLRLATGVTCPSIRYHPAIIAQAAATLQIISDGRFTLGIGAGERLSERIVGQGWPEVGDRHRRLREALEIIRLLWSGGTHSYRGDFLQLQDARVYDLPDVLPEIVVAVGGPQSAALAAELGDGLFATDPDASLIKAWQRAGGSGPRYAEVPTAFAPDERAGAEAAHARFRFGPLGWKVLAELPDPTAFDQATQHVRVEDMADAFACGPDVERHVEAFGEFADAGFDHLALMDGGPDPDAFFAFFADELGPRLRAR
ncbi:TIGR03557 family F420-dependent LLM class oxidoreductase [Agrococcus sediminis]|uniref:TIGR03557 family F420-dependent LLM class oxidoreductase n=1 Tax=Agrococcus sediminis TaxID=2599924 RepID=A0A5M8Q3R7_9MICO|nr:TIGR03557 family F420-dependent LLM class oxidoreductase [Agrococcus sediminis]KAA6430527.1 TIGR03557 family F420-dependent LLM class oxidoreductase [Agrococcus sediminis]